MMIKALKAGLIAGLSLCALATQAAPVSLVGDNVTYVYDDTQAALTLFGTPTIVGDVVRFLPPNFRAESANGAGVVTSTANFVFTSVFSHNGLDLEAISVTEFGDYEITNGDAVSARVLLTASNNKNFFEYTSVSDSFNAAGSSAGLQTWGMTASLDPATAFASQANDIALSIQNTLTATTDAFGELAWIQKKLNFVAVASQPVPDVPLPAAAWLFGSAILGLIGVGRRKKSQI
jgi:hypothetical protein